MLAAKLTHLTLPVTDLVASVQFYQYYAGLNIIHQYCDTSTEQQIVWLSDSSTDFILVLVESQAFFPVLAPFANLGVTCSSAAQFELLCTQAHRSARLIGAPKAPHPPFGYRAKLRDPDGHILELMLNTNVPPAVIAPNSLLAQNPVHSYV
ncbi:VOC family protein [Pseudoalteromonas fenneropenaei]|uniref:VOC family protein n=1 Tax=Pseudoalteromonas fenneropenaei TaxID=1737459 RepID=A0ABV7CKV4_9GAMM